jgi:4-amino-4-deoxy-L-arabinose transferase-like glycosyltransferase
VFASIAVVAAACIAGQLVGVRLAPLAAVTMGAFALEIAFSTYVVFVDLPAMAVALVGVALFVRAARTRRMPELWAAAAVLTLAALTREALVYLVVFAALSASLEPEGERLRRAIPWLVALGVFAVGYTAHALASAPYVQAGTTSVSYFNGGLRFLANAFDIFAGSFAGYGPTVGVVVALGVAGAVASHRRTGLPFATFAVVAVILPLGAMLWLGNSSYDAAGNVRNYWGVLVIPLALSLWPVAALWLAPARPDPGEANT